MPTAIAFHATARYESYARRVDGGGTKRAETVTSYDSTNLTSVTGIPDHDDTNFGASYTLRSNPTVVQRWTGSSHLSTTLNYDTTGQAVSQSDPAGNLTSFSYADNFYVDNAQNPPSQPSPTPPTTNAYLTGETLPLSGSLAFGYYYNSGKRTLATDQNGATGYILKCLHGCSPVTFNTSRYAVSARRANP